MLEQYQILQKTFMWLGPIFVILGALCGIGWNHYGLKIKEIEKQVKPPQEVKKTDSTIINTFHVKGDYVNGNKNVKKSNVVDASNALIVTNNQSGGQNIINYYQNEFKLPNDEISNSININIQKLIKNYPNHPFTTIEIESGNSLRDKVASQLELYMKIDNLGQYSKGNVSMGRFPDYPISVFFNTKNKQYVEDLIESLKSYIAGEFHFVEMPDFPNNFVRLYINGQPQFDISGKVKIE
jgi:hypothetical protein